MGLQARYTQDGLNFYDEATGDSLLTIAPDGTVNVVTAGKFQVAGVTGVGINIVGVTATADELNQLAGTVPGTAAPDLAAVLGDDGELDALTVGTLSLGAGAGTAVTVDADAINALTQGVAGGYKVARGVHLQAAAVDTVVTGLATVVAVVVSWIQAPTAKQAFVTATIGNQAGAPAAGSVNIATFKSTYAAADDFTDSLSSAFIAIGT